MVFAGPNGSGKTTVAHQSKLIGTYVNADCLKADYGLTDIEAAQNAEAAGLRALYGIELDSLGPLYSKDIQGT
jgi:predicted ABC-type ATPase